MIKTIPKKNKCKKAKWLSEEALQIAVKRREVKSKGEKERYTHLKAEFQRIARRDKKAFLSDQCKEIEENNRMGKTRDLFKKIRDTKGCKDGLDKGQKQLKTRPFFIGGDKYITFVVITVILEDTVSVGGQGDFLILKPRVRHNQATNTLWASLVALGE